MLYKMKWTIEMLQDATNKYKTRGEFQIKNPMAYQAALRKKIIDELFKNHYNQGYTDKQVPEGYWTKENLQKEVNKHKNRREFSEKNSGAYCAALRKKFMDELFKNHPNQGYSKNRHYWTKETLQNHPNQGYSDIQVKWGYWTNENLQNEANKYLTRKQFEINSKGAYTTALNKKIMDDLFKNHPNQGYSEENWKDNNYVIYVYELEDYNKVYVGLTNNIIRRDREHLFNNKEKLSLFCKENNLPLPKYKILENNLNSKNVQDREKYWYNYYKENDCDMFNITKTGSLGAATRKWSKKALQKEADKYKTRSEFQKENGGAYITSLNKKIMDDLFKNHLNQGYTDKQVKQGYWTIEILQDDADKCKTRGEFQIKYRLAYNTALRKKFMDELFKNHPNQGYINQQKRS